MKIISLKGREAGVARASLIVVAKSFPTDNIRRLLDSTRVFSFKYELVIVAANFCKREEDVTKSVICRMRHFTNLTKVKIVLMEEDLGVAYGRNIGAMLAESPNLIFADDDVVVLDDVKFLIKYLEDGVCHGVQPLILKLADPRIVDSAGDFVRQNNNGFLYVPYSRAAGENVASLQDLYVEELPSMRGAFMIVKKEVLLEVGGFDNTFNFGYEEVDLGWRMTIAGYKLLFVPFVKVLHTGGRSTDPNRSDEDTVRMHLVNYYIMQLKITPKHNWPYVFKCFLEKVIDLELWRIRKMKVDFLNAVKDMLIITKLLTQRLRSVQLHKELLTEKFHWVGLEKFKQMSLGKRFIHTSIST